MNSNVIYIHDTRAAKADAIFGRIDTAARRMGYSEHLALLAAQSAKQRFLAGLASPARIIGDTCGELRRSGTKVPA